MSVEPRGHTVRCDFCPATLETSGDHSDSINEALAQGWALVVQLEEGRRVQSEICATCLPGRLTR